MRTLLFSSLLLLTGTALAQEMSVEDYEPVSTLVVPEHYVPAAKYPFIDVHSHFRNAAGMSAEGVDEIVATMDSMNMAVVVNLSGRNGNALKAGIANMKGRRPNRIVLFANIDFSKIDEPNFGENAAAQLEEDVRSGAQGLKIFKNLGMFTRFANGERMRADDPMLDPIWAKAGELSIPVLIHVGEPAPFYEPHDQFNERWLELKQFPRRKRPPEEFPTWEQQMEEQHNIFRKHPNTIFINAHLGWMGNDLGRLGKLMDELPNMYVGLGAVLAELGRQPITAREWMIKYQDRIVFGKDSWNLEEYRVYFRVFETNDQFIKYYRKRHAHWRMYGLDLPDETLRHIYYKNALRIIPGLDASLFPDE